MPSAVYSLTFTRMLRDGYAHSTAQLLENTGLIKQPLIGAKFKADLSGEDLSGVTLVNPNFRNARKIRSFRVDFMTLFVNAVGISPAQKRVLSAKGALFISRPSSIPGKKASLTAHL